MRKLTNAELKKVRDRSEKGDTVTEIARKLKIRKSDLISQMKKRNIPNSQTVKHTKRKNTLTRLIKAGLTYEEISREMRMPVSGLKFSKWKYGIALKIKVKKRKPLVPRMLKIHTSWRDRVAAGEKKKAIADEFGYTYAAVQIALKRLKK